VSEGIWIVLGIGALALVALRALKGGKVPRNVVQEKLAAGAVVVDVRSPDEYGRGAYPGALNIPVQVLGQRMSEIPRGKPVVVYCASGARSAMAAMMLSRAGYADVVNAGGLGDMPR
jgi:phage shock protein E